MSDREAGGGGTDADMRLLIAAIRRRFEHAWRSGECPTIESFVEGLSPDERAAALVELVALELAMRTEAGPDASPRESADGFPSEASLRETAPVPSPDETESMGGEETQGPPPPGDGPETTARDPGGESTRVASGGTTAAGPPGPSRRPDDRPGPPPAMLGRYRVLRPLGTGTFGVVYQARDDDLGRDVAIKVPTARALQSPGRLEALLAEARLAAGLRHPAIVGVFDVGRAADGSVFIVLEYVPGTDLAGILGEGPVDPGRLAAILAEVADAVHHAHEAGLVHRDLKPANIIVDERGTARVTDFGLALAGAVPPGKEREVAGSPSYMAPEQVRGEVHRLDGRTDVWAIGVMLYLGLTGRPPFAGRDRDELFEAIRSREPEPPAEARDGVPAELARICLKCLSKRMADRYASALELAEDLRHWRAGPAGGAGTGHAGVIPRGLRAFDGDDADFFLSLLPGPRGRDGLPESVRFWKSRIEGRGAQPFRVGLLYGPSGAGKSSLVRAGLLPRLGESIRPVYIEASAEGTEARTLAALERAFPGRGAGPGGVGQGGLPGTLARLREEGPAPGEKALLVFDQFEQWLQAHPDEASGPLVDALRQCDGSRLQAMLLVRDDFWMAVTRFFRAIEVPLLEGDNSASVEPFDEAHAMAVLREFGRAYGRLPAAPAEPGPDAAEFLRQAIDQMRRSDGGITPVHLCLFADVLRRSPWTTSTLRGFRGIGGIGETFLRETFDSPAAPPSHRLHRQAAQGVLQALLPPPTSVLRGKARAADELRVAAGYSDRPGDFDDLMRMLDSDLRLVTPVDRSPGGVPDARTPAYQLAHDFLVVPIRQWIERSRRASRAGRARNRLATITAAWVERPVRQRLPSSLEWAGILAHTRPRDWSADERRMMRAASASILVHAGAGLALAAAALLGYRAIRDREEAAALLRSAIVADDRRLADMLPRVDRHRERLREALGRLEREPAVDAHERDVATLLLFRDRPTPERAAALRRGLEGAGPDRVRLLRAAHAGHEAEADAQGLRRILLDESSPPALRLRAASLLAALGPFDPPEWEPLAGILARALLEEDRRDASAWAGLLGPVAGLLPPALGAACGDASLDPGRRATAAEVLADILGARGDAGPIARWLVLARPETSLVLLRELERRGDRAAAIAALESEYGADPEMPGEEGIRRRAVAAIGLAALGRPGPLADAFRHRDDPSLRARAIQLVAELALAPRILGEEFFRPGLDASAVQAALMAWAETPRAGVSPPAAARLAATAAGLFAGHPDPGVHSAADLLLRRWERPRPAASPPARPPSGRGWLDGPNGHTFAVIPGPAVFPMGSPASDPDRFDREERHLRRIDRTLAAATTEVTVEQYRAMEPGYQPDRRYTREPGCPAAGISWFDAARYCNWLSRRAGLPKEQWCYPDPVTPGSTLAPGAFDRSGFRLPTEAEWEFLCRAGTVTSRPFGDSLDLMDRYARTWRTSKELNGPAARLLPNEFGLFDMLGGLWEWCQDGPPGPYGAVGDGYHPGYPRTADGRPAPDHEAPMPTARDDWRIVRGGTYLGSLAQVRSGFRDVLPAGSTWNNSGFRVVRTLGRGGATP
ncbi:Serine/threonine-protein kinase PknB (plasmid) [Aquisphaera giovannonii]|uniref:Serine/threonine-protein kinase PknB n=1 Tax=Aquisphaera giovannonii TaxID=406548 RepID=A0A5B9WFN3_9BACT|nr:bifunctional serine/threonine-protein kinase/formylglycine-generating enzyme family protein [Aquisphaera giovannonii]QEH39283.1 Serine/threonine-protein kinase PknB [Aquisphaera giovannonii]